MAILQFSMLEMNRTVKCETQYGRTGMATEWEILTLLQNKTFVKTGMFVSVCFNGYVAC